MQQRSARNRIVGATALVALVALIAGPAGSARTTPIKPVKPRAVKELAQLRSIQDRDGETYQWVVDGVPAGLAMK